MHVCVDVHIIRLHSYLVVDAYCLEGGVSISCYWHSFAVQIERMGRFYKLLVLYQLPLEAKL
jgi:hypothetical protein